MTSLSSIPSKVPLAVLSFLLLLPAYHNQRTYRRTCDCEYTIDGRCAYTLLLPATTSSDSSPVCPQGGATNSNNNDKTPGGSTGSDALALRHLASNVTEVREHASRQSWMLNQLQSAILTLQTRTETLFRHVNLSVTSSGMAGNAGMGQGGLGDGYEQVKEQREELLRLRDTITSTQERVDTIQAQLREYAQSLQGILQEVTQVSQGQHDTQELLQAHGEHLQALSLSMEEFWVALPCMRKGLLVDGQEKRLEDSSITVSSTYNPEHGAPQARINNMGVPGSWCPSKYN